MSRRLSFVAALVALVVLLLGVRASQALAERLAEPSSPLTPTIAVPPPPIREPRQPRAARAANELVSTFVTRYAGGEPRVVNIRRAAELLDGTTLASGETFSMNEALGPRTTDRGFVPAPMILRGQFVDSVGGGISQVATALYNAAFLAGLELVAHTPHSIYINRYPLGREATVSWGGPELVFRNDWPARLRMRLRATDTTLTVRFYSERLGRRVETETAAPVFAADGSFAVDYTRRVYRDDVLLRAERFTTRYER